MAGSGELCVAELEPLAMHFSEVAGGYLERRGSPIISRSSMPSVANFMRVRFILDLSSKRIV